MNSGETAMTTGYVWNELYGWHNTSNYAGFLVPSTTVQPYQHFESSEGKVRFNSLVEVSGLSKHLVRIDALPATVEDILRVHTPEHVERIQRESLLDKGGDAGDGESPFGNGGYDIALLAAGGAIQALRAVVEGTVNNAYALVRPPGHHARPSQGMGFCIFGNAAVAIQHVRANLGVERVAVVDWDVHHGNGTQEIFDADPNVLKISIHQDNLFPYMSGPITARGIGEAEGSAINIPLPAGCGNGAYLEVMQRVVLPAIRRFNPDVIVVPSGFDASAADPLGRMMVTAHGYSQMTTMLLEVADEVCDGKLMMTHEGGYSPTYVPYCGLAVLETMSGVKTGIEDVFGGGYNELPDQAIKSHQRDVIDQVVALAEL
jgi:acetoin utilization deacetylase AcuC-like enzyme